MARPRILVVDDEEDIVAALQTYLEGVLQADVLTASSGPQALSLLDTSGPVDLVISDYRMPVMNGIEFLQEVRNRAPDVPRLLLTAFPDMEVAIQAVNKAHIVQFLTKPVEPEKLMALVRDTLSQSQRQRQGRAALERASGTVPARVDQKR